MGALRVGGGGGVEAGVPQPHVSACSLKSDSTLSIAHMEPSLPSAPRNTCSFVYLRSPSTEPRIWFIV